MAGILAGSWRNLRMSRYVYRWQYCRKESPTFNIQLLRIFLVQHGAGPFADVPEGSYLHDPARGFH